MWTRQAGPPESRFQPVMEWNMGESSHGCWVRAGVCDHNAIVAGGGLSNKDNRKAELEFGRHPTPSHPQPGANVGAQQNWLIIFIV